MAFRAALQGALVGGVVSAIACVSVETEARARAARAPAP